MPVEQTPVEPADLIILAISVIVPPLRPPHFVSHEKHGGSHGKQGDRKKVLHLPVSKPFDIRIVRGPLYAAIPAQVVVGAVAVLLSVGLVVLLDCTKPGRSG